MNYRKLTKYFIVITLAVILIYDIYAVYNGGVNSTISQVMADWSLEYAPLNYLIMYALGHFTWPVYVEKGKI